LFSCGNSGLPIISYSLSQSTKTTTHERLTLIFLYSPEEFLKSAFLDDDDEDESSSQPRTTASVRLILRPQHTFCSLCPRVARHEDVRILLQEEVEEEERSNKRKGTKLRKGMETGFWRAVPTRLVKTAYLQYRADFDMFGYDLADYFARLGLEGENDDDDDDDDDHVI
jgi:hypothetical protein